MKHRKVTKKMVKEALIEARRMGISLTETQFLLLLLNNEKLRADWDKIGDIDTAFREELLQAITKDCNVEANYGHWPTGRASLQTKETFGKEFIVKARRKGYRIDSGFSFI